MEGNMENLLSCIELIKNKVLKHSDKLIARFSVPELKEETESSWNELKVEIDKAIDVEVKKLLSDLNTIENVSKLIELREKYDRKGQPAWTYSASPSDDVKALSNVTSKTLEPQFSQMLNEGEAVSQDLSTYYQTLKENIADLDKQISELSTEITMEIEHLHEIISKEP